MKYDLIIIGSGSVGAAAGYYATRAGLKVLMTDAHMPPHQQGSHHGDTRLIRHAYGEGEKYVPLVLRAQTLWDELSTHNEEPIFVRSGVVNLGPADSAFLANVARSAQQWQLNVERTDATALMTRWPEIRVPDNYIGLFEADSGFLRSELAITTWLRLAREAGCAQLFNSPVSHIHHDDNGVTIETSEGSYHASKALISAGTGSKRWYRSCPFSPYVKFLHGLRRMDVTALKPLSGLYRRNAQRRSILRFPGGERRVKNRQTQWRTANTGSGRAQALCRRCQRWRGSISFPA